MLAVSLMFIILFAQAFAQNPIAAAEPETDADELIFDLINAGIEEQYPIIPLATELVRTMMKISKPEMKQIQMKLFKIGMEMVDLFGLVQNTAFRNVSEPETHNTNSQDKSQSNSQNKPQSNSQNKPQSYSQDKLQPIPIYYNTIEYYRYRN